MASVTARSVSTFATSAKSRHHQTRVPVVSESKVFVRSAETEPSSTLPSFIGRRGVLFGAALSMGVLVQPHQAEAFGKSAKELAREAKERRAKLKETAQKMKSAGKSADAFDQSNYSVPEEATTPNVVNRNRNVE